MKKIKVPSRKEVSPKNQLIFDEFQDSIGFVPNIHATLAYSDTALENYMRLSKAETSLSYKERESINLIVSQVNNSKYCIAAHSHFSNRNGFTKKEILEIRNGHNSFDPKLDILIKLTKEIAETKGKINPEAIENFLKAGYTMGKVIDIVICIADKMITNYIHNITQIAVDFPQAPELKKSDCK
ncbi:carboxymuconolactone decarboxylase family protein [Flavobacterium sp. UBA7682]|uniref:carboxymuconolactone decarboxylase family protein n=1 Tax=Flavobacterium sp. UBA7682 TaxID=1946560 RepID=UPI0025B7F30B|nr:carboxymuconolactone decarboxylase family protein [Flavobacterium sp. UBA7682]